MIKKILCLLILTLTFAGSYARKGEAPDTISAIRAFLEMPSGELDMLSKNARADMLDYYATDSVYRVVNNMKGRSWLLHATPDFLEVRLTEASTMQFKVLEMKDGSQIIMTVYTVGAENDSRDSTIKFYDSKLNPLKTEKFFTTPKLSDFFDLKGYKTNMKEIEEILPFYTYLFEANAKNSNLTGKLTYEDRITTEDQKILELFLRPQIVFSWNGSRFSLQKKQQ